MFNLNTPNNLENSVKKRQLNLSRLFVCILAAVLVLSIGIATAFNQQPTNADTSGDTNTDASGGTDTEVVVPPAPGVADIQAHNHTPTHTHDGWTVLTGSETTLSSGNYYLTGSVTYNSGLEVAANSTVTLCLDGYVMYMANNRYITLHQGSTFNLYDCNSTDKTRIHINYTSNSYNRWQIGGESPDGDIRGGVIQGVVGTSGSGGSFIYSNETGVTVNMYGGTIMGCCSYSYAVVQLAGSSKFNMYGGAFVGNCISSKALISVVGTSAARSSFTMYDGIITETSYYNQVVQYLISVQHADFTIKDGSISNNYFFGKSSYAVYVGVIDVANGSFAMEKGWICNNNCTVNSSAYSSLYLLKTYRDASFGARTVSITGGYFCGNTVCSSRAIFYINVDTMELKNIIVRENGVNSSGSKYAAGCYTFISTDASTGSLTLENCDVQNNYFSNYIINRSSNTGAESLRITNCDFSNNTAASGGILLSDLSTKFIVDGLKLNNITEMNNGSCVIKIIGNSNAQTAGTVGVNIANLEINNTQATTNYYQSLYVDKVNVLTVAKATITKTLANTQYGSAIYSTAVTNKFDNITLTDNVNVLHGSDWRSIGYGCLYAVNGTASSSLEITDSHINNNSSHVAAGVYVGAQTVTITNTEMLSNSITSGQSSYIAAHKATLTSVTVKNSSYGVYLASMTEAGSSATVSGCTIQDNKTTSTNGGYGGLYFYNYAVVTVTGSVITGNASGSSYNGGGICVDSSTYSTAITIGGEAEADKVTVSGNDAGIITSNPGTKGGGIYINGTGTVKLTNVDVTNNRAGAKGGGICFYPVPTANVAAHSITMTNCNVTGNSVCTKTTENYGGGVQFEAVSNRSFGTTKISQSHINENQLFGARQYGGGLSLVSPATVTDTEVCDNKLLNATSVAAGGGIYTNSTGTTLNNVIVSRNSISNSGLFVSGSAEGGGIYASGVLTISGGEVSDNTVSSDAVRVQGGGMSSGCTSLSIENTTFSGNTLTDNYNYSNTPYCNGGGIYLYNSSLTTCNMNNVNVVGNEVNVTQSNKSDMQVWGGGIYLYVPTFNLVGCTISNNTVSCPKAPAASMYFLGGGGLLIDPTYLTDTKTAALNGCTVQGNSAPYGGGIYFGGTQTKNKVLSIVDTEVLNNVATYKGGGICSNRNAGSYVNTVSMSGTTKIAGNTASAHGGVYLNNDVSGATPQFIQVQGAVQIKDNAATTPNTDNLYVLSYRPIGVAGKLTADAEIHYNLGTMTGFATTGYGTYNGSADPAAYFYPDGPACTSVLKVNNSINEVYCTVDYKAIAEAHDYYSNHTDSQVEFTPFNPNSFTAPSTDGAAFYYLTGDTTVSKEISIGAKNSVVMICLNGYHLVRTGSGSMFSVDYGATLYILDCNPIRAHKYTGSNNWVFTTTGDKIHNGGALRTSSAALVVARDSEFYMYGGSLISNSGQNMVTASVWQGSGNYLEPKVYLENCSIVGSYAPTLINGGKMTLKNVKIHNNTTTGSQINTSGFYLEMDNCDIYDNIGNNSNNVCINANHTKIDITNTQIHDNHLGAGVILLDSSYYAGGNSVLTMSDSEISNNEFTYKDGYDPAVVSVHRGATFNMSDSKIVDNRFQNTRSHGCAVYVENLLTATPVQPMGVLNLSGNVVISGNRVNVSASAPEGTERNVLLNATTEGNNAKFKIAGKLTQDSNVGVTIVYRNNNYQYFAVKGFMSTGYRTYHGTEDPNNYFYSDTQKFDITQDSSSGELTTVVKKLITLDLQYDDITDEAYVYENTKLKRPTDPVRYGWDFLGWYTDTACTQAYDFNKTVTTEFTLYAKWQKTRFAVTFDTDHGTTIPSQSVEYQSHATRPTSAPSKGGYRFVGWYTDANLTNEFDFANTQILQATTIYAKWAREYSVVFYTNGGSAVLTQKLLDGETITEPTPPTRHNYAFVGWFTDNDTFENAADFTAEVHDDVKLYAKWEYHCEHSSKEQTKAVAPTCVTPGNLQYWYCPECKKYFEDEACTGDGLDSDESFAIAATGNHISVTDKAIAPGCESEGKTEGSHCSVCGQVLVAQETIEATGHVGRTDAPTCTAAQVCRVCNKVMAPATGHDWATEWSTDGTYHWHACKNEGCNLKRANASHTFKWIIDKPATYQEAGEKHRECSVCHFVTDEHTVINQLVCTHTSFEHVPKVAPTCEKDGCIEYWFCPTCTEYFNTADLTTKIADASTWNESIYKLEKLGHDYVQTVKDPTCTEKGAYINTCSRCGDVKTTDIPALGHNAVYVAEQYPTCTEDGWAGYYHCQRDDCGKNFSDAECTVELVNITDEEHSAQGHAWGEYESNYDATCVDDGTKTRICQICGETETVTDVGSALDHEWDEDQFVVDVEPTCTTKGSQSHHCLRCDATKDAQPIDEIPHTPGNPPTCDTDQTCTVCGTVITPARGHSWATEWSYDDNTHWHVCTVCGVKGSEAAHSLIVITVIEPTESKKGLGYEKCEFCDQRGADSVEIPKKDCAHADAEHRERLEATCTENGYVEHWYCPTCKNFYLDGEFTKYVMPDADAEEGAMPVSLVLTAAGHTCDETVWSGDDDNHWHVCTVCGESFATEAHTWEEVIDKEADEFTAGIKHEECSVCHAKRNETYIEPTGACKHTDLVHTEAVAATCKNAGNPEYWTCTNPDCGKHFRDEHCTELYTDDELVLPLDPNAHVWNTEWSTDRNNHWHVCTVCDEAKSDNERHDFKWIIDQEATADLAGIRHQECSVCGMTRNENNIIPPTGTCKHTDLTYTAAVEATCQSAGNPEYWTCRSCGKHFSNVNCTALYEDDELVIPADPSKHVLSEEWSSDENGHWHVCSVCHERVDEEAHDDGGAEATCYDDLVCTVCGHVIKKAGHTWLEQWERDGNNHWHICEVCGDMSEEEPHTFEWRIDKEATDTEKGIKHEECSICHARRNEGTEIPAGGETESDKFTLKEGITEHPYKFQYGDFTEETDVSTYVYNVDKPLYITRLALGDTLADLLAQFANDNITAWDKDGNQITDMNTVLATGMMLRIMDGETVLNQLTLSVLGDINGDGVIKANDKAQLNAYTGETLELKAEQLLAGDINGDKAIKANDKAQLNAYTGDTLDIYAGLSLKGASA